MSAGFYQAALFNEQLRGAQTARLANAAIRDGAAQAGGYLALLGAYQVALSQAAPDHPLHLARVRQVIQDAGANTARRTMDLNQVWSLDFDPHAIARELQEKFQQARDQLRKQLQEAEIEKTWGGFLWGFPRWEIAGIKCRTQAEAQELRARMLQRLEAMGLDDDWDHTAAGLARLTNAMESEGPGA